MTGKSSSDQAGRTDEKKEKTEINLAEEKLKKGRWMWYLGAAGLMISYVFSTGIVQIDFSGEDDWKVVGEDGQDVENAEE